jgi:hypothetical protein
MLLLTMLSTMPLSIMLLLSIPLLSMLSTMDMLT